MHADTDDGALAQRWRDGLEALAEPGDPAYAKTRVTVRAHARRRRRVLTAGVAVIVVAGAGIAGGIAASRSGSGEARVQAGAPISTTPTTSAELGAEAQPALAVWSAFPANASPRPIVLLEDTEILGTRGFPDDLSKDAYLGGAFVPPSTFPTGPSTAGGYPLISARDALGVLKAEASPGPPPQTSLTITDARLGTATFLTDRGRQELPAWLFTFRGVPDPAAVAAVAPPARFVPEGLGVSDTLTTARTSPDGRDVTLSFWGDAQGPGPCTTDYAAQTTESSTAVAVSITSTRRFGPPGMACAGTGQRREVTVRLRTPLGGRVLATAPGGEPIPVTP